MVTVHLDRAVRWAPGTTALRSDVSLSVAILPMRLHPLGQTRETAPRPWFESATRAGLLQQPQQSPAGARAQLVVVEGPVVVAIGGLEAIRDDLQVLALRDRPVLVGIGASEFTGRKRPLNSRRSRVPS